MATKPSSALGAAGTTSHPALPLRAPSLDPDDSDGGGEEEESDAVPQKTQAGSVTATKRASPPPGVELVTVPREAVRPGSALFSGIDAGMDVLKVG
jgi:hypothetical protein